jgi:type II secretory pathway component PulC
MKNPLWIFNDIIFIILLLVILYIIFLQGMYKKSDLAPLKQVLKTEFDVSLLDKDSKIIKDSKVIYLKDIFNTYKPIKKNKREFARTFPPSMPVAPVDKVLKDENNIEIQFLDPLPFSISGIVYSSNELKSYVTLVNNNTKKSSTYMQGDKILDAYIVRIFPNKVMFIRSNGQQESIFTSKEEALKELNSLNDISWDDVVIRLDDYLYYIETEQFKSKVHSFTQFMDMLDSTIVNRTDTDTKGIKIGNINDLSLGHYLGFQKDDIILKINGLDPLDIENRIKLYEDIVNSYDKNNFIIKVEILRDNTIIVNNYSLEHNASELTKFTVNMEKIKDDIDISNDMNNISVADMSKQNFEKRLELNKDLNDLIAEQNEIKSVLSNTVNEIKNRDKRSMRNYGSKRSILKNIPIN